MMKILNICVRIDKMSGGGSVATLEISRMLISAGIDVDTWIIIDKSDGELLGVSDINVKCFSTSFGSSKFRFSLPFVKAIISEISQYDAVLIGGLYLFPNTIASFFCKVKNIPYILFPYDSFSATKLAHHGFKKMLFRVLFDNKMIKHASLIQAANKAEQEQIIDYTKDGKKIFIAPYGFHINDFKQRREYSLVKNRISWNAFENKTLLFLARVSETKGVETLLSAFEKLLNEDDSYRLVIVGPAWDKEYNDRLISRYDKLVSSGKVIFTGMVSIEEKYAFFQSAYLYILPSYSENFGITVLEAAANGVVPIVTNSVPWPELLERNAGYVVATRDDNAIVNAILSYAKLSETAKNQMKNNAINLASDFDCKTVSTMYVDVLKRLLASKTIC